MHCVRRRPVPTRSCVPLSTPIDAEVLSAGALGRLRVVANIAVGYDNIDVEAARRHQRRCLQYARRAGLRDR